MVERVDDGTKDQSTNTKCKMRKVDMRCRTEAAVRMSCSRCAATLRARDSPPQKPARVSIQVSAEKPRLRKKKSLPSMS